VHETSTRREFLKTAAASGAACSAVLGGSVLAEPAGEWIDLFDGRSLGGWKASGKGETWRVADGCLVGHGSRSHLFYQGPVGEHDFRDFELLAEVRAGTAACSGIFFHAEYQESDWPKRGYDVQINNTHQGPLGYPHLERTGSLCDVRNLYKSPVADNEWFRVRISVVGKRIRVWINDLKTVDYVEPDKPHRSSGRSGRVLSHGTIALEAHDPSSRVSFRSLKLRFPSQPDREPAYHPPYSEYGLKENLIDRLAASRFPVVDYHVHLRGGMTVEKAVQRQASTGINLGVLKNIGKGWAIETDDQLRQFLDETSCKPLFVGLQVNDRDWMHKHDAELLRRLDYVLGDTMIMPMPNDDSESVKLWEADKYEIADPRAWMKRYIRHNLRVLSEPITILANPTYLPPAVEKMYDVLWTDERMKQIIQAANENRVALEINARSGLPHDRFIRIAKSMGAKFTFGTNNFKDGPIDMSRCFEAIDRYRLAKDDIYLPGV